MNEEQIYIALKIAHATIKFLVELLAMHGVDDPGIDKQMRIIEDVIQKGRETR